MTACCNKSNIATLSDKSIINRVCLSCGDHWYGSGLNVLRFSRKEWDALMDGNACQSHIVSGVAP